MLSSIEEFKEESKEEEKPDYSSLCVLVVDDTKVGLKIFIPIFRKLNIPLKNVFLVGSADEARKVFETQQSLNRPIDVVFTDLGLGAGDDGFALAQSIRKREADQPHIRPVSIIIVSGSSCQNAPQIHLVNEAILKPAKIINVAPTLDNAMKRAALWDRTHAGIAKPVKEEAALDVGSACMLI
jgi:CheY-like chemotaxis protein